MHTQRRKREGFVSKHNTTVRCAFPNDARHIQWRGRDVRNLTRRSVHHGSRGIRQHTRLGNQQGWTFDRIGPDLSSSTGSPSVRSPSKNLLGRESPLPTHTLRRQPLSQQSVDVLGMNP